MKMLKVSVGKKHTEVALVVATGHDRATKQMSTVAKQAERILETAGYQTLAYYEEEATCTAIFVKLFELRNSGSVVKTGFLAAHGSEKGLHNRKGNILIDSIVCEQLSGAILVVASCLHGGELPKRCVNNTNSIKACIGFKGKLWMPIPKWWSKLLDLSSAKKALDEFKNCILHPMSCLLSKRSVWDSTKEAKKMWSKKASCLRKKDKRIAWIFEVNCMNQNFWGQGSARL